MQIFKIPKNCQTQRVEISLLKLKTQNSIKFTKQFERLKSLKCWFDYFSQYLLFTLLLLTSQVMIRSQSVDYSKSYMSYMVIYRLPLLHYINYIRSIINMGNQTTVRNQIKAQTSQFISLLRDPSILHTVYDGMLNKEQIFLPNPVDQFNHSISYNQKQLLFSIASQIITLSNLPVNRSSSAFRRFTSYLFPGFSHLINNTKYSFHNNFQILFKDWINYQLFSLIFILTFIATISALIVYKINHSLNSLGITSRIISEMDEKHFQEIQIYQKSLFRSFNLFNLSQKLQNNQQITQSHKLQKNASNLKFQINLTHKNNIKSQQKKMKRNNYILFFANCAICIILVLCNKLIMIEEFSYLANFQMDGFSFLRYYPTASIVGLSLFEKYKNIVFPNQKIYFPEKYAQGLAEMELFGKIPYMNQNVLQTTFYAKRRNYFFGNPCQYNPSVLVNIGVNMSQCQSGVSISSSFILDIISTWSIQFNLTIQSFQPQFTALFFLRIVVLYFVLMQATIFQKIEKQFEFENKMFNHFLPTKAIHQKRFYQQFINKGLIQN